MEQRPECPAQDTINPGKCPQCGRPAEWLPIDEQRQGRACRACGWVQMPEITVVRHTVSSVLRKIVPESRWVTLVSYLEGLAAARRSRK